MNVNEGASRRTARAGEQKPETFDDYLKEAERSYKTAERYIHTCFSTVSQYSEYSVGYFLIKENDNHLAMVSKVNELLHLDEQFQGAMSIFQAKENIESALKLGAPKKAEELAMKIKGGVERVTTAEFQYCKAHLLAWKSDLVNSLSHRYEAAKKAAAHTSNRRIIQLKDAIGNLVRKFPSPYKCY